MQWGRRRAFAFLPVKWNENSGEKEENGQRAALLQEPKGAILRMGTPGRSRCLSSCPGVRTNTNRQRFLAVRGLAESTSFRHSEEICPEDGNDKRRQHVCDVHLLWKQKVDSDAGDQDVADIA